MFRHLLALLLLTPFALCAQESACTPFDNNGDNVVGIGDLIDLLARFGDSDLDVDGIWDSVDDCVGAYDPCGICNGPGPQVLAIDTIIITYDSIYVDAIDEWLVYELQADTLLHLVCENPGCTDPLADNYDPYAEEGGPCVFGTCQSLLFDSYAYTLVQIGDQCWFAENLRTTVYADGSAIPEVTDESNWLGLSTGARCDYNNDGGNQGTYGRLYNWYAVDDARGLCPSGWHVPTDGEWTDLENYITTQGFSGTEGTALKSTSGWESGGNGTDDFGFSALPGGVRSSSDGNFYNAGYYGNWWSSSPSGGDAWYRFLSYSNPGINRSNYFGNPRSGFSVRCLRDVE
ncbi:fibrobacter succinogenes major paralogous domain-containing protein [Flavobacteriales bacterium]|nr:fibrobacter succinogenes major paralogous domain-containing protein [Flavobacteriales bacterium]